MTRNFHQSSSSSFIFNFFIGMIVDIGTNGGPSDLIYADDVFLPREHPSKWKIIPESLNGSVGVFEVRFAPSKQNALTGLHYLEAESWSDKGTTG